MILNYIWIGFFVIIGIGSILYWGYLAWFHPDKLKEKLIKDAEKRSTWPFSKTYSVDFAEKHGVRMMRFNTLVGAVIILLFGIVTLLKILTP